MSTDIITEAVAEKIVTDFEEALVADGKAPKTLEPTSNIFVKIVAELQLKKNINN